MITRQTLIFSEMREKQFEIEYINNYIMNSNDNFIKHLKSRRYFIINILIH
jgi:hypothetical protein